MAGRVLIGSAVCCPVPLIFFSCMRQHPNIIIIQQKHIPLLSNTIYNHTPDKYMHRRNARLYTNTKKSGRSPP